MRKSIAYIGLVIWMAVVLPATCLGQTQTQETKFLLLEYGLPDPSPGARIRIAAKWGIEFRLIAGCMVGSELIDSIVRENRKVEALLETRYGKLWREQLNREVHEEEKREQVVSDMLDSVAYIRLKKMEVEKQGAGLLYFFTPVPDTTLYRVSVEGWGKWNGNDAYLKYYELLVDYRAKTLQLLNGKPSKK